VLVLNVAAITILLFFAQDICNVLFTSKVSEETLKIFYILLVACLIIVPSIMMGHPFLSALGYSNYANNSVIYASIFHLLGLAMLIVYKNVNVYSVAYLVVLTQLLDMGIRLFAINKYKLWSAKEACAAS